MKNPLSTYRIQFNKDFTFKDFERAKDYFKKIGVRTIYASPIFDAVPGSTHGYDVCDPLTINPEIGDEEQLLALSKWLKEQEMLWLQDIVPNHMAYHPKNKWLMDVLEKGTKSSFKSYFDAVFTCPVMEGKLMVPFLGKPLAEAVEHDEIVIKWIGGRLVICYSKNPYPVKPSSYSCFLEKLKLDSLLKSLEALDSVVLPEAYAEQWENVLEQIKIAFNDPLTNADLQSLLDAYNQNKQLLLQFIRDQNYELCYWEETNHRINYRRFFTVNGLICLNIQDENVFERHHQFVKKMIGDEVFDGLRIDHIDGLFEPNTYLKRLRGLAGKDTYIVAEKILEQGEELPVAWPIQGNTGYDFLGMVNNLFTQKSAEEAFDSFYQEISPAKAIAIEQLDKKRYILEQHLAGELDNMYRYFVKLQLATKEKLDKEKFKKALGAFLVYMPVYRFYSENNPISKAEQEELRSVFQKIRTEEIPFQKELEILENIFLQPTIEQNDVKKIASARFFKRCMQFSGPLMAKGVEDTLMYTNFRFIGHNEVGDHPANFGITVGEFHALMKNRQKQSPLSLNATSTHDTKRGEDARARLNVLTALPTEWFEKVGHWQSINRDKRQELEIQLHEEYFIYQCLLAHYPIARTEDDFEERLIAYLQKAFREGKQHSDWAHVNTEFENNVASYISYLLSPENEFLQNFKTYHKKIAFYGAYNSLAQMGLKFTCPGVPDVYQGSELWDFSFVDPDNRRKVDYALRLQQLEKAETELPEELIADYQSGNIKLWLCQQLFQLRNNEQQVFTEGDYIPVKVSGKYKENVIAFIRKVQHQSYLIVSLLNPASVIDEQGVDFSDLNWEDTTLHLAEHSSWFNLLQKNEGKGTAILLNSLSLKLPFAVLKLSDKNSRHAGILMHISSLPANFGVGDLGPEAYRFVDFLKKAGQRYWQLLPIGLGASNSDLSPYSTLSSMAANPLFISPELLVSEGDLQEADLSDFSSIESGHVDFQQVKEIKGGLLKKAFLNQLQNLDNDDEFQQFIADESDWLQDFSLFMVLKAKYNQPWYQWPDELRSRNKEALEEILQQHKNEILEQQWYQYIFQKQWKNLKNYCSQNDVHLIGDIPFYVNHDSSDVWANPGLFSLKADGSISKMAGVPPDYFSADGQLWGMPIYNWQAMAQNGYQWWLKRLHKNISWFNLLRLDHFRAFCNYWEVDASEETAVNGEWKTGPGSEFLNKVKTEFPEMPFIAEDLGDVSDEVFKLRDEFELSGMKVLQFEFGADMPISQHIPHQYAKNFIVYTGTHDNNTTRGWFKNDLTNAERENLSAYLQRDIDEQNVAGHLINLAYASVAKTAIVPIQDFLNLDESERTNRPGTSEGNWSFRLTQEQLNGDLFKKIKLLTYNYGR